MKAFRKTVKGKHGLAEVAVPKVADDEEMYITLCVAPFMKDMMHDDPPVGGVRLEIDKAVAVAESLKEARHHLLHEMRKR